MQKSQSLLSAYLDIMRYLAIVFRILMHVDLYNR